MKPRWMTLKWLFLLLAALLPIGLISVFALAIAYKSVRDLVKTSNQAAVSTMAEMLARDLGLHMNLVKSFAAMPEFVSAIERGDVESVRDHLRAAHEIFPQQVHLYVADNDGQMWSHYPENGEMPATSREQREWLGWLKEKAQPVVSGVYGRGVLKSAVVALAAPVLGRRNTSVGMLVCEYPLDEIGERLRQLRPGGSGIAFILDPHGIAAAHPRLFVSGRSREDYAGLPSVARALAGVTHTSEYYDPVVKTSMVGSFQPVNVRDRRWVVVAAQPVHEAYATLQQARLQIGVAAGILAMGAMGIVTVLGRSSERNRQLNQALLEQNRQLNQERFLTETLMYAIPDQLYFKDRDSRFLRINPAMAARFNLARPEDAVGKTDFDFFTREHAEQAFRDEQEIIRTGQPLVNREEKETWPDGSVTWVSTTKICLRDKQGQIMGTFGLSRDITARKQAEDALAAKARELARSNKDLEEFAYVASHDLQEPLRMIASYTQLLERRYKAKLDQDAHEFIAYAVDGANRMQVLINDLLAYSRVGTRGKPFALTCCNQILARTLSNLKILIEETGATVTSSALPQVLGDTTQLTQLFQNLVNNAIKFRRQDEPPRLQISATLEKLPPAPGETTEVQFWHFAVSDNGIGIEPKFFERIFIIFQRLHTRDQYPGTGIGLSVCKKIVERHGGRIWVESEPGQGTTFHFTLPAVESAA